jgi:hypothetical protein
VTREHASVAMRHYNEINWTHTHTHSHAYAAVRMLVPGVPNVVVCNACDASDVNVVDVVLRANIGVS